MRTQLFIKSKGEVWFGDTDITSITYDPDQVQYLPEDEIDMVDPSMQIATIVYQQDEFLWVYTPATVQTTIVRGTIVTTTDSYFNSFPPTWWIDDPESVTNSLQGGPA